MLLRTHALSYVLTGFLLALTLVSFIPVAADAQTGSPSSILGLLGDNCPAGYEPQTIESAPRKWVSLGMYIPTHWIYAWEENPDPGSPSQLILNEFRDVVCRSKPSCTITASAQSVSPGSPVTIEWSKKTSMIPGQVTKGNNFHYTLHPVDTGIVIPGFINIPANSGSPATSQDISDRFIVSPQQTTTYTATVRTYSGTSAIVENWGNWEAEASCSVTVNVGSAPPPCADRNYELACSDPRTAPYRPSTNATEGTIKFRLYSTSAGAACENAQPVVIENGCIQDPPQPVEAICQGPERATVGEDVTRTAIARGGTGTYSYTWGGDLENSGNVKSVTKKYNASDTWNSWVMVTSGDQWHTASCPALTIDPPLSCTGAVPANASLCIGDDTSLNANTTRTLISACTAATKCEYTCNTGYTYQNGSCVVPPVTATINAPDCTISVGNSSCSISVTWNASSVTIGRSIRKNTVEFSTAASSAGTNSTLAHGTHTFAVYQGVGLGASAVVSDTATASCVTGSTWNSATASCVADQNSCTGTLPANASAYTGDNTGTIAPNTSWAYSASNTTAKCEFACNAGFMYQNGSCVATPVTGGACGSAHGTPTQSAPSANLCVTGNTVTWTDDTAADNQYNWRCTGTNGTVANCSANRGGGTATIDAPDCTIIAGNSSCVISLTWDATSLNTTPARVVTKDDVQLFTTPYSAGTNHMLEHGTYTFAVKQGTAVRASDTATASCAAGSTWNGTVCTGTPPPAPTLTFNGSPTTIAPGNSSTLTWTVTNADSCWASGGWTGWKAFNGTNNQQVTPSVTTTYSLECYNGGVSSGVKNVIIRVNAPPPTYSCTGAEPSQGVELCSGDKIGLTANTPYTTVDTCTAARKCEYRRVCWPDIIDNCSVGLGYIGGSSQGTCVGVPGSCRYQCTTSGWTEVSNQCTPPTPTPSGPPTITTNKPIVPSCEEVELDVESNGHLNCTVSGGALDQVPIDDLPPTVRVCANTTFLLDCDAEDDSVTVEVVGAQFET